MTSPIPLFIGLTVDEDLRTKIANANLHLGNLFLHDETGNYLQELILNQHHYLGKWVGTHIDSQQLKTIENHIFSIIARVIGPIDRSNYPLKVHPVPQPSLSHDN